VRAPGLGERERHVLYIFARGEGSGKRGGMEMSFNPACLKWQAYLRFCGIAFVVRKGCNHASPSGSLPFLMVGDGGGGGDGLGNGGKEKDITYVTTAKMQAWAKRNCDKGKVVEEPEDLRYEAYLSLIDLRIRRAWVCCFHFLTPLSIPSSSLPHIKKSK
jgi:metaxin